MKKIFVAMFLVMFVATFVHAKMVDSQTNARTVQRIQRISQILDNARNQVGVEYAAIQADIVVYPSRYDANDITNLQSLAPYLTIIKNDIIDYEAQKETVFPDM